MDFDYTPALRDDRVELRPQVEGDFDALHAAASDPLIWEQHPVSYRHERAEFRRFFESAKTGALTIIDHESGTVIGSSRFHGFDTDESEVEIGWSFLARSHWGGDINGRVKRLMLDHAFQSVDTVVLLAGADNHRSRRAIEKIGGVYRGERPNARGEPSVEYIVRAP